VCEADLNDKASLEKRLSESKKYVGVSTVRFWHNYDVFNPGMYLGETINKWSKI
jgi:hypothetical protein